MKLQICAEVEGHFMLKDKVSTKLYPYEFSIFEKQGKKYISVTKPVDNYMEYAPRLYKKNGQLSIELTKEGIYRDLLEWLFYIESVGAFDFEIQKIHKKELEVNWICETDDEKGLIPILSCQWKLKTSKPGKYVSNEVLSSLVWFRKTMPEAHIPFGYYRQGVCFFEQEEHLFAFINFYMMLEFCFADGKTKKQDVTKKFLSSLFLELCVLQAISLIRNDRRNFTWMQNECIRRNKLFDFEGVVFLFIKYRGLLSHATIRSKPYLYNDQSIRPLTLFIRTVCFMLCGNIEIFSTLNEEQKNLHFQKDIEKLKVELSDLWPTIDN